MQNNNENVKSTVNVGGVSSKVLNENGDNMQNSNENSINTVNVEGVSSKVLNENGDNMQNNNENVKSTVNVGGVSSKILDIKIDYLINNELEIGSLYEVDVWCTDDDKYDVGDIIVTTSSEFAFNMVSGRYDNHAMYQGTVTGELVDVDCENYVEGKCNNGGCYSYHYYKIVEKVNVGGVSSDNDENGDNMDDNNIYKDMSEYFELEIFRNAWYTLSEKQRSMIKMLQNKENYKELVHYLDDNVLTDSHLNPNGFDAKEIYEKHIVAFECDNCGVTEINYQTPINSNDYYAGDVFCTTCLEENTFTCDNCGELHMNSEAVSVNVGEYQYCLECAVITCTKCDDCGGYYTEIHAQTNGNYCDDCCGKHKEVVIYDPSTKFNSGFSINYVRDYHEKPKYGFTIFLNEGETYTKPDEMYGDDENPILFGIENEINFYREKDYKTMTTQYDLINAIMWNRTIVEPERDCTVSLEFVFKPASLKFLNNSNTLEYFIETIKEAGAQVGRNTGMHVHINRESLSDELWLILEMFVEHNHAEFFKISRRVEYNRYARPKTLNIMYDEYDEIESLLSLEYDESELVYNLNYNNDEKLREICEDFSTAHEDRYHFINMIRDNTVEFRFFKATIETYEAISTLNIIDSLVRMFREDGMDDINICRGDVTFNDFIEYSLKLHPELEDYYYDCGVI